MEKNKYERKIQCEILDWRWGSW